MPGMMDARVYPHETHTASPLENMMMGIHLRRYRFARDWLRKHLDGRPARILDIACGSGFGAEILSELGTVVGVDIDPEAVAYARGRYANERVSFLVGDADEPAFLASLGTFDAVVTCATVEHIGNAENFLRWIRQALRSNGACVACFPSAITMDWAAPHHKRDLSVAAAGRLFERCGLRVLERYNETHRLRLRQIKAEFRTNPTLPVPPVWNWIRYYLLHPRQFLIRLWQISPLGPGVLFGDQDYLLVPQAQS
jgi:SAM-dependent methyltransferase